MDTKIPVDARTKQGGSFIIMRIRVTRIWVVQSISLLRILATLLFALLAFKQGVNPLLFSLYSLAIVSDLLDGYLSRKLDVETYLGRVLDLVADKSLTAVSLLYASATGIDLFPLAVIATRDLSMIGLRLIVIEGAQLLPTNRIFGGIMSALLWGNTLALTFGDRSHKWIVAANAIYWVCAVVLVVNLGMRVHKSQKRIKIALTHDPPSSLEPTSRPPSSKKTVTAPSP